MNAGRRVVTVALVAVSLAGCATMWPPFTSDPAAPYTADCAAAGTPLQRPTRSTLGMR